ncbi:MAG TPA: DUF2062 domain-containing protein [Opitutus sp.]|nr:DUF2062 domain-containing protein [Opitutus sp.]
MSPPSANASPPPARTFWQRRVRDPIVLQLTQGITPEKIALTLAVGSALALFPIIGTTTLLCFLVGLALRLNQPIIQLINQAFWPVHVPAIFLCVKFGEWIFGVQQHAKFSIRYMNELLWNDPGQFLHRFGIIVGYALVAWAVLAPFYIAIVYYIALPIMRAIARIKAEAAAKAALAKTPEHPVP